MSFHLSFNHVDHLLNSGYQFLNSVEEIKKKEENTKKRKSSFISENSDEQFSGLTLNSATKILKNKNTFSESLDEDKKSAALALISLDNHNSDENKRCGALTLITLGNPYSIENPRKNNKFILKSKFCLDFQSTVLEAINILRSNNPKGVLRNKVWWISSKKDLFVKMKEITNKTATIFSRHYFICNSCKDYVDKHNKK